jgi:hypothetical protein
MLDVHPPHHAANTWRDFFIHIATIVIGLLIAVGLEQTVEAIHRHREAREARENIQREIATNLAYTQRNVKELDAIQQRLAKNLDLLNSGAPDAEILLPLEYAWYLSRPLNAAWDAAKINGSLALIPSTEIASASYFYASTEELTPTIYSYFKDLETAEALVDHAKIVGKLTANERQQLLPLTSSAMGLDKLISQIYSYQIEALQSDKLQ